MSKCQVRRCHNEVYLLFYGFGVCEVCWSKHCDGLLDLKKVFKISDVLLKESNENFNKENLVKENINKNDFEIRSVISDDWRNYFKGNG